MTGARPPSRARPKAAGRRAGSAFALVVALGSGACAMMGARFDSSWGPLGSPVQIEAMVPTLAPDPDVVLDLPRFFVEQDTLPSGLRVGVEPGPARGMVAVVAVVGTGSSSDPPAHEGLAHLVEHLVYHAHARDQRPESERLVRLGAAYNADTSLDATRFYEAAPAAALPALLDVAAERLQHPLAGVDDRDFERERAIVENELYQRNETGVYGRVVSWMQRALFPAGHPYARPIGGSPATLHALTLADARAFAAAHYRPENATLLVTGEVGPRAPLAGVVARLPEGIKVRGMGAGEGRAGKTAERAAVGSPTPTLTPTAAGAGTPAGAAMRSVPMGAPPEKMFAAVATPEIWIAYDLGPSSAQPAAIGRILTTAAAEAAVRERLMGEPEVLGVEFHPIELRDRMLLGCQIVLEHDRRREWLARSAQDLIWSLWSDNGPPAGAAWADWQQGMVYNLQQAALTGAVLGAEPFLPRAIQRALSFQITGTVDAYDRQLWSISATRTSDVSRVAYRALAPERARTLFLLPMFDANQPAPGPVGLATPANLSMDASPFRAADFGAPPSAPPPPGLREARAFTLANGLTVVLLPRPGFPAVSAMLGFHGGAAALPTGVLPLVRAVQSAAQMSAGGPRGPTALKIERADSAGFTADLVRTDRRHLSNALYLLANRVQVLANTDWTRLVERAQARLAGEPRGTDEPRALAAAKVRAALYGRHAYGTRVDIDDLRRLNPELPQTWLPHLFSPRNAVLVIAGDMDVDAAAHVATGWFSEWQGAPASGRLAVPPVPAPPLARAGARTQETVLITDRHVGAQVEVTFACRLPFPVSARERAAQRVAGGLLGGYLSTQIRERGGAAYSVEGTAVLAPGGGAHLAASMSVDSRRLRDALRVLHEEIDSLAGGRFDKAALSQVQWGLTREGALRFQTASDLAEEVLETLTLGLPIDAVASDIDELARVGPDDVQRAFAACASAPILSLVGDRATIRASM